MNFDIIAVSSKIKMFSTIYYYLLPFKSSSKFGAQEIAASISYQYLLKAILRSIRLKYLDIVSLLL